MSIAGRISSLEKQLALRNQKREAAKPFLITFCIMAKVPEDDERFYSWRETEPAQAEQRGAMIYGGEVTFYASSAEQFRSLKAQYDAGKKRAIITVTY